MENIYFVIMDKDGKAESGTSIPIDPEYVQVSEEVYNGIGRAFYVDGEWTVYDPLTIENDAADSIAVGEPINVTAKLPEESPDTEITFTVLYDGEPQAEPTVVEVIDGQAAHPFVFATEGIYVITATSAHHGSASVGVTVVAADNNQSE